MKYINIKVLKTGSHYVAPTSLALSMQNRLVSKLERSKPIYLCLPGATMPGFTLHNSASQVLPCLALLINF